MSSLMDQVLSSDQLLTSDNNQQDARSEASVRTNAQSVRSRPAPSIGTPAASTPGIHSDVAGFDDDEIAGPGGKKKPNKEEEKGGPVSDVTSEKIFHSFHRFLETFNEPPVVSALHTTSSALPSHFYYIEQVKGLARNNLSTVYVDYQHVMRQDDSGVLADAVANEYYRFQPHMVRALNIVIEKYAPQYFRKHRQPGFDVEGSNASTWGTVHSQEESIAGSSVAGQTLNQQTDKIFTLAFYNLPLVSRVRALRAEQVGRLVSISGTVTRTSEVRPELLLATFMCEACNTMVDDVEQVFRYTEPTQCPNETCGNRQSWRLDLRESTFVDWQKVRIQENSSEIPTGSMPRTMDVILRGEMVDRAKAGEKMVFTGTPIVVPDVSQLGVPGQKPQTSRDTSNAPRGGEVGGAGLRGLKALGVRDLTYRMVFLANMVSPDSATSGQASTQRLRGQANNILSSLNQTSLAENDSSGEEAQKEFLAGLSSAEIEDLKEMVHMPNIFMRLVDSLAPMVYGHSVVKKGLLLQLMGGVPKKTAEGMALRGDINICIVGDPSTSKSQFLKYICSFIPRAVYTSGKASSAAGLTAAVIKDEETGEFTIEAGALMLADNGICAIDEFDKMDIADQVAIHEAMEQQTISIAKAGIQATLNARTSILAAANPVGGRYNRKLTLRSNINMSAPIMSRFDLFFVVLDECNKQVDTHLARHIVGVHQLRDDYVQPEFSTEQLQRYIRFARTFRPEFTDEAKEHLVGRYKQLRADDAVGGAGSKSYRITVRQLESMIRLSEGIAKANCVDQITPAFVDEAFGLLRQSIVLVEKDDVEVEDEVAYDEDGGLADEDMLDGLEHELREPTPAAAAAAAAPPASGRTQLKFEQYMTMVNLLVRRINQDSLSAEADGVEERDLVMWYLEQVEEELERPEDMETTSALVKKVLKKMLKENIVMQVLGEGLNDGGAGGDEASSSRQPRRMFVMHPNCAVDDM